GESAVATVVVEQRAGVALGGAGFSDVREYDDVIPALHHACHGTVEPCEGVPERGEPGPRPGQGHASELVGCTAAHGGGDLVRVLTEHAHGELFAFEQHGERVGRAHHGDQDHGRIQRQGGERLTGEADDVSSRVLGGHDGHPCAEASEKPPQ